MADENEIDYKPKYSKEFTKRLKIPKTEIQDIKINPVDPTYFYVFKVQSIDQDAKIFNYTATEDKFEERMAEVRDLEMEGDDDLDDEYGDEFNEDIGHDLFEKTLAYMRNNKIYSVGRDGKAKEDLENGIQGAGQDAGRNATNRTFTHRTLSTAGGMITKGKTKLTLKQLTANKATLPGNKAGLGGIIEESGESGSQVKGSRESGESGESEESSAEENSEESSEEEGEDEDDATPESSGEVEESYDSGEGESSEEESADEENAEGESFDQSILEGGSSQEQSDDNQNQPENSKEVKLNEDSKLIEEETKRNIETIGSNDPILRDSVQPLKADQKTSANNELIKNPVDMRKDASAAKIQKEEEAAAGANPDQPEAINDQIDKNAIESYSFDHVRSENSGMVLKKFKNVLMCCKFEQYGYSIKQKLYADEMGNDANGNFKFSSRMIFSSCGQYFATFSGNKYIIYNCKSLKAVKDFELDQYENDPPVYYGASDENKILSSDAKFLASKSYSSIFIYRGFTEDAGSQVAEYTNVDIVFYDFMNSNYLIGVLNQIDTSYICKVDVTNEEFPIEKINGSYSEQDITQNISNIKFNPKGKACAFVVNENTLYYLDLTRKNSTPQKVLERFDRIIYDVDSDRISIAYMQDNQGYI